jgi:DNA-binding GntR family transcriptional regulator
VSALRDDRPLVDHLAAVLQSRVLSGEIPTGTRLRQEAIASEFGVSRTPVREALRKLQALGVAVLEPNRGAVVRGPSAREVREAYEVRAELEGFAAERAAALITDTQLQRLRDAQRLFQRSISTLVSHRRRAPDAHTTWDDDSDWVRANDLFHQAILEAAGNERLLRTIRDLHVAYPRALTWSALSGSSALLEENVEQHAAILEAIEARDAEAARRAMTAHIRSAGELVARRL